MPNNKTYTAYLDTCIVSGLAKEDIADQELKALDKLLEYSKNDLISLFTSNSTLDELQKIPEKYRSKHLRIYNLLSDIPTAVKSNVTNVLFMPGPILFLKNADYLFTELKNILPDEKDAEHILNAAKQNIIYFVTLDKKTILEFSEKIEIKAKIKAVKPSKLIEILNKNLD